MHFWQRRKPITALQIAVSALEACRKDQLEHAQLKEYHSAMCKMLKDRDSRLVEDIARLSSKPSALPDAPEA